MEFGDANSDLLVEKDLSLDMAERDFVLAVLQQAEPCLQGQARVRMSPSVLPSLTTPFSPAVDGRLH